MTDAYYIFVDTETTGLPKNWRAPATDLNNWPRMVQIAWLVYDKSGNKLKTANYLIKPNGFVIPDTAIAAHGITNERAKAAGSDLIAVLYEFATDLQHCNIIVGHNISFDVNVITAECIRIGIKTDHLSRIKQHCTMKTSRDFCRLKSTNGRGYKYPKLAELYRAIFGKDVNGLHDALADITATAECFWALKELTIKSI